MNVQTSCPQSAYWKELLNGNLPKNIEDELTAHLDLCESCQRAVEELGANTPLGPDVVGRLAQLVGPRDDALQMAMNALKANPVSLPLREERLVAPRRVKRSRAVVWVRAACVLLLLIVCGAVSVSALLLFSRGDRQEAAPPLSKAADESQQAKPLVQGTRPEDPNEKHQPVPGADLPRARPSPEVMQRVKNSTVFIEVLTPGLARYTLGSGVFGVEPGIVLTNAHVLGMLGPASPPPATIKVVLNSGDEDEWAAPGKILGVDPSSDLAVLKILGPKDKIPPPLKVVPTSKVRIAEDVFVVGFPVGVDVNRSASIRRSSVSAFLRDEETKELRRIQLEGGAGPGRRGGPVVTENGDVVGILAESSLDPNICFCIPGDHIFSVVRGGVDVVTFREPYRPVASEAVKLPVEVHVVDPLGRVKEVGIELWAGHPGDPRPRADSQPNPRPGDSQRQSMTLTLDKEKGIGTGELTLADKDNHDVYWAQPFWVTADGAKQWEEGTVSDLVWPPAERRPANLVVRHSKDSRSVELISKARYRVADTDDEMHELTLNFKTNLTETTRSVNKQGVAGVTLQYDRLEMKVLVDGRPVPHIKSLEKSIPDAKYMGALLKVDKWGNITESKTDIRHVPEQSWRLLETIGDQVATSLSTLAVPLANNQVQPLQEWYGIRELPIGDTSQPQTGMLKMKYTYVGSRRQAGREEAVIAVTGEVAPLRGQGPKAPKARGLARGTAIVDLASGKVIIARLVADIETEMTIQLGDGRPAMTGRAGGRLEVSLRRGQP